MKSLRKTIDRISLLSDAPPSMKNRRRKSNQAEDIPLRQEANTRKCISSTENRTIYNEI